MARSDAGDAAQDADAVTKKDAGHVASSSCRCDAASDYCLSQPQFSGCPDGSAGACRQEYGCTPIPSSCATNVTCARFYDAAIVGAGGFCGVADGGLLTAGGYQ